MTFQLLLIDVAKSFNVQVGTASLLIVVGSFAGIVIGLLTSILSVRFNHKTLMLIAILGTVLAALGYFFAPTFALALLPNIGVGLGYTVAGAMVYALIGDLYPLEKRGRAVGWMVAAAILAFVIGAPLSAVIAGMGSWRTVIRVSVLGCLLILLL